MQTLERKSGASHGTESNARKFCRNITVTLYALVVAAATLIVVSGRLSGDILLPLAPFVLSLCSMIAIWSASYRPPLSEDRPVFPLVGLLWSAIPCAATTFSAVMGWYLIARLRFFQYSDSAAICWGIAIGTQVLVTLLGTLAIDTFSKGSRRKFSDRVVGGVRLRTFSFSIGSMILWTTFVAFALLVVRMILIQSGWIDETPKGTAVLVAVLLGLCGAVVALIWLVIYRGAVWAAVFRRSLSWFPVFLLTAIGFHLLVSYFHPSHHLSPRYTAMLVFGQVLLGGLTLTATLNHTRR